MKRATVRLKVELPSGGHAVLLDSDAQVTEEGDVLARETAYKTWRRVGSVTDTVLATLSPRMEERL